MAIAASYKLGWEADLWLDFFWGESLYRRENMQFWNGVRLQSVLQAVNCNDWLNGAFIEASPQKNGTQRLMDFMIVDVGLPEKHFVFTFARELFC